MQRAAVSVPSNIAEGEERGSNKDALRFLYIAKGSLAELRTQAEIALATKDLSAENAAQLDAAADQVARLLSGMIKRRVDRERATQRSF
jgi:four helix bundle protein